MKKSLYEICNEVADKHHKELANFCEGIMQDLKKTLAENDPDFYIIKDGDPTDEWQLVYGALSAQLFGTLGYGLAIEKMLIDKGEK